MNNRGQFGLIAFIGVFIVLLALAPILLNIVTSVTGGVQTNIASIDAHAGEVMQQPITKFTAMWDYVIVFIFAINILLLLITSFFIDTHPIFTLVYIFMGFLAFVFTPYVKDVASTLWDTPRYITDGTINELSMTGFLLDNYGIVLLMVFVLSGIIMYAKIKYFGNDYA